MKMILKDGFIVEGTFAEIKNLLELMKRKEKETTMPNPCTLEKAILFREMPNIPTPYEPFNGFEVEDLVLINNCTLGLVLAVDREREYPYLVRVGQTFMSYQEKDLELLDLDKEIKDANEIMKLTKF